MVYPRIPILLLVRADGKLARAQALAFTRAPAVNRVKHNRTLGHAPPSVENRTGLWIRRDGA